MAPARRCLYDIVRRGLWCTGRVRRAFQAPPVPGAANAPAHGPELRRQCIEIMRRLLTDAAAGHPDAGARPDKFRNLRDGWHEDGGEAPSRDGLDRLRGAFWRYYPKDLGRVHAPHRGAASARSGRRTDWTWTPGQTPKGTPVGGTHSTGMVPVGVQPGHAPAHDPQGRTQLMTGGWGGGPVPPPRQHSATPGATPTGPRRAP